MKINLIIFISEFNRGGAGNSLFKMCKYLPKNIFNISIICLNKCEYKKELQNLKIKLFQIKSKKTIFAMQKVKKITQALISNKYKKNIFLSNIYYTNILTILFLRNLKMKIILIERTPFQELSIYFNWRDYFKKILMKFLINFTYRYADLCISNSSFISREYNKRYNLNFKTIFPPSYDGFSLKKKNIFKKKTFIFGTVCRLSREKGLFKFLKILSKLKFDFKFLIIGDGPEKKRLQLRAQELKIKKKILFNGFLNSSQVKQNLKQVDLFINCSYFEGFPNSVVEALSIGVPVIASQSHGGINEILKGKEYGYIYKDDKNLLHQINKFYFKNKSFFISKKKIHKHLQKFSIKNNVKNYSKVFKDI
jgi:glycosyltransferase involved in cell wall biosynthesis